MLTPLFSVIIPVYNAEKYLNQCLDSIMEQNYKSFEVIVVNDGSSDNSGAICDHYVNIDLRFKVIHKENGGVTSARKAAAKEAKGQYIVCVDSDDWISPDYLAVFAEEITRNSPDIICCGYYVASENGNTAMPVPNTTGFYDKDRIRDEIFPMLIQTKQAIYFRPSLWAKAFRRDLFDSQQRSIDGRIMVGEDGACVIPCIFNAKSISILPECTYYYRINYNSITKTRKPFEWDGPQLIAEHIEKQVDLKTNDFQEQLYRKVVHELFTVAVSRFYQQKPYEEICEEIKKNLKRTYYRKAIRNARFSGSVKAIVMMYSMKMRWTRLMKFYSKYKWQGDK